MRPYDPNFILTSDNRGAAVDYLIDVGYHAAALAVMTNVELVNTYHKEGWTRSPVPTETQRATSEAIARALTALPAALIDPDAIRAIVREELANMPPRRLLIETATTSVTLDGPIHYMTEKVIRIAGLGHAIMLVGPAGCGKTTIGEHAARALGLPFYITSTVNDTHELMGFTDGYGKYHSTSFRNAYETGGVWIADEIDAWDAPALLAANSALANGLATFPDLALPVRRHANFRMVATANTFGTGADRVYIGRNELDAASLDRFAVITVDYDLDLERLFAADQHRWLERVWAVRRLVNEKKIRHVVSSRAIGMGAAALSVGVPWDDVEDYYLFKGMSERDRDKISA